MPKYEFQPIGYIRSKYSSKAAAPPSSRMNSDIGELHIMKKYEEGLAGLDEFSHLMIVFCFHKQKQGDFDLKVHPRLHPHLEVGLFSCHSPRRVNRIGVSFVEIRKVVGNVIYFKGVDMLDGTPVLDIKPISSDIKVRKSGWLRSHKKKP
jgi:tRNA-Thr(GGU) m(6)t(6)A37 methyltransferase TsaA